jgi:hypothetical protein
MADFGKILEAAGILLGHGDQAMSSYGDKRKYDMVLEQVDPHTLKPITNGMKFTFRGDDLPDGPVKLFDGSLKTIRKEYPNNTIPDTQVIRTFEKDLQLKGHFQHIDAAGVAPMDKIEFLHTMRLQGYPCKLTYMGDRIIRYGFIVNFAAAVNDEHDIEWELDFEIFQIADDKITSNTLPILTTIDGRNEDILGRLNSGANALANVLALLGMPDLARSLRNDMRGIVNPAVGAINSMGHAADVFKQVGSITGMSTPQYKDFANKLSTATQNALTVTDTARGLSLSPNSANEQTSGLASTLQRRQVVRSTAITAGRVSNDLQLMQKDASSLYNQQDQMHIVTQNDTLRGISQKYYGNSDRWQDIARANSVVDPQQITMGMRLVIPK